MTKSAVNRALSAKEDVTISGYGFRMVINGSEKPQIFNDKDEPVTELNERVAAQQKLVLPLMQQLGASWQQDLTELSAATQKLATIFKDTPAPVANDNKAKKPRRGSQVEDGSYYMGVSPTTGTNFYLFIEPFGPTHYSDGRDIPTQTTFDHVTTILQDKFKKDETFHGHKFSQYQLDGKRDEDEIVRSYHEGTADGGIRRLTIDELTQVEAVFEAKPKLRQNVLDICYDKNGFKPCLQSASLADSMIFHGQSVEDGDQRRFGRYTGNLNVMVGRSDPKPR